MTTKAPGPAPGRGGRLRGGRSNPRAIAFLVDGEAWSATIQASATFEWSGPGGDVKVNIGSNGSFSASDGPLTVTDSGIYATLAKSLSFGNPGAAGRTEAAFTFGTGGASLTLTREGLVNVSLTKSEEGGIPALEATASALVTAPVPHTVSTVSIEFEVTVKATPPQPRKVPDIPVLTPFLEGVQALENKIKDALEVITIILEKVPPIEIELPAP